jgi:hypothetical protein
VSTASVRSNTCETATSPRSLGVPMVPALRLPQQRHGARASQSQAFDVRVCARSPGWRPRPPCERRHAASTRAPVTARRLSVGRRRVLG